MSDKQERKKMCRRLKTILGKLLEAQDLGRREQTDDLLPSSTEGFIQDLMTVVYEYEFVAR